MTGRSVGSSRRKTPLPQRHVKRGRRAEVFGDSVGYDGEGDGRREVTAFCYDTSATRHFGYGYRTSYPGLTEAIRSEFQPRLQISPDTPAAWDSGILRTYTGRVGDWPATIRTRP